MGKKILMIDDSKDQTFSIETAFDSYYPGDYDFISLQSGAEGFKWLENNDAPDVIILDIQLPEISGFEIFDKIRANSKFVDIPIIFLSGDSIGKVIKDTGEFFADGFMEKPIEVAELKATLDKILKNKIVNLIH